MVTVHLYGKHSNRTPLAYEPYRHLVQGKVAFEATPDRAEVLLLGFKKDLIDHADQIQWFRRANPRQRVVIISEEPLWDSVWSGDFLNRDQVLKTGSGEIPFRYLNHANSDIFKFEKIPYFPTTSTDYLVRYATLFTRNAALSADDILCIWEKTATKRAYYLEKRTTSNYGLSNSESGVVALSLFRSQLAEMDKATGVVRVGHGWSGAPQRQDRPDWHLEKLAALDRRTLMVSALENTVAPNYITEKIFDAYAVLAIPFYFAEPSHAIWRVIAEKSFVNIKGLSVEEALVILRRFKPDRNFAEVYLKTQRDLASLFQNSAVLRNERKQIVARVVQALESL